MPKIVQIGMGGSDVAAPPTELTTNLDPALLFEDGTTGDDFIEIDTTTSAEKLILAAGGAKTGIGASPEFCADKGLHIQTGDSAATSSDVHADADDLIVEGSGNSGISILTPTNGKGCLYFIDENTGGTPDGIAFDQGTGSLRFQVANSERLRIQNDSVIRIFDGGKLSTGSESSPLCASNGIHIKEDDTGIGSANTHADMLVIEANTHPGLSFLSNNTSRNTIAFGDPQSSMAGELRYTHGGGSNADMFFLLMQNSVALNVDHDHKLGVNHECADSSAQLTVKGNLTADLTGTFTATNGSATLSSGSSTAFNTQLEAGSAIEIFESGTSRGVFTVASITSATELVLDSTVSGLSSSPKTGMTGKTDADLLDIQTGDSQTALTIKGGGFVGIADTAPKAPLHIVGQGGSTGMTIDTSLANSPTVFIENSTSNSKDRCVVAINGDGNSGSVIELNYQDTRKLGLQSHSTGSILFTENGPLEISSSSGAGDFIKLTTDSVEAFRIDNEQNTTITLDNEANSIFKVVDNKTSPATYLKITQDGISQLGTTTGQTKLFGGEVSLMPTGYIIQTQGYSQLNKIVAVDGGATTATLNVRLQFSGPGQAHHVNPSSSAQVFTLSIRDSANVSGEQANTLYAWERMTLQFHNTGSAACTVKATTPNGTLRAVDASGASIGACDGTGFSVAANTTIGFRVSKFNAKHASGTTSTNVVLIETLWTASNS